MINLETGQTLELTPCTGPSAQWCPVHGDCTCPKVYAAADEHERTLDASDCPLHRWDSDHAEGLVE